MRIKTVYKALSFTILLCLNLGLLSTHFLYRNIVFANSDNENTSINKIIISELAPFEASNLEWIEIYNNSDESINIQELKLIENDTRHSLNSENNNYILPPHQFVIIANNSDQLIEHLELSLEESKYIYDSSWSSLNLSGEILQLSLNDIILDSINYGESTENTSLERDLPLSENKFSHHPGSNSFLEENSTWNQNLDCDATANLEECSSNCELNPESPECTESLDCLLYPNHPECLTEPDCQTNPELAECQTTTIYCELEPNSPDCENLCPPIPDPIVQTEYIYPPTLLISEVSFKDSTEDWIEIYISPNNSDLDLSQYFLKIDNSKIPLGTETIKQDQLLKLKTTLVGTTEQITIQNEEQIFDTICWTNSSPTSSEIEELENLIREEAWSGECLNSEDLKTNQSLSRQNFFKNSKSKQDWQINPHPTPEEFNYFQNEAPISKIEIQSGDLSATKSTKLNLDGSQSLDPCWLARI